MRIVRSPSQHVFSFNSFLRHQLFKVSFNDFLTNIISFICDTDFKIKTKAMKLMLISYSFKDLETTCCTKLSGKKYILSWSFPVLKFHRKSVQFIWFIFTFIRLFYSIWSICSEKKIRWILDQMIQSNAASILVHVRFSQMIF